MSKEQVAKLPSMELKFFLNVTGTESGVTYTGDFVYKRPNIAERSLIESMRVRLNGDLKTLNPDIAINNEALAHLKFTIKEAPTWWADSNGGASLHDENVLFEIYNRVIQYEAVWRQKVYGGKAEDVNEGSQPTTTP